MRPRTYPNAASIYGFNPRICKRCDKGDKLYIEGELSFNPRICKRCDYTVFPFPCITGVSIHASVKDAT